MSREPADSRSGCAFWDRHHHISENPDFWMAHPACREAINFRVSGDPGVWPLDFLHAAAGRPRFERLLSLGCGTGRLERAVRRLGIAEEVEGVDGSAVSIDLARQAARSEGLSGIEYRVADLDRLELARARYDAVVFHASLHHVASVERLLQRVRRALRTPGFLFLDEWTGPSRSEWNDGNLERPRELFARLPAAWRRWPQLRPPIEENDPSEAVRSSAILPALRRLFRLEVEKPYGGQIISILLPQVAREAVPADALEALVAGWLALETAELDRNPASSYHAAILARPRRGIAAVPGEAVTFAVRARLAMRHRVLAVLMK
jgi:SAM-dependent methyltransferase